MKKLGFKGLMPSFHRSIYKLQDLCNFRTGLANNTPVESAHVCTSHNLKRYLRVSKMLQTSTFYYATIAYHVGLNADLGLPHPGPTS